MPLQGHFASDDSWVTPAAVDAFERRLAAAQKRTAELEPYEGTVKARVESLRKRFSADKQTMEAV